MEVVYSLMSDHEKIRLMQAASLKSDCEPMHGLIGSPVWWMNIKSNNVPHHIIRGTISRVYLGSMLDWPSFEITSRSGELSQWTREANTKQQAQLYRPGVDVELAYVLQRQHDPLSIADSETPVVLKIRIACELPVSTEPTITLYRPVNQMELDLVKANGNRKWPARLPGQPIFYPVTNEIYAAQITVQWNVAQYGLGYVTRFRVKKTFMDRYKIHQVGTTDHTEWWIPAADLNELNSNILGEIEVLSKYEM